MNVPRGPQFPGETPVTGDDVLARSERERDQVWSGEMDSLANMPSRPITDAEQDAAERDRPRLERVYAPASMRVPRAPAPGHERLIEEGLASQSDGRRQAAEQLARDLGAEPPGRTE